MANDAEPGRAKAAIGAVAAAIALIVTAIFSVEGGYVNNPRDPGGETHHGVTKAVARENGYQGPMRALTRDRAFSIYQDQYIRKPGFLPLVERDRHLAEEVIDSGANAGPARAARWLQESLNHLNRQQLDYPDVVEDGRVGPATIAAFDALRKLRGAAKACALLVKLMDAKQAQHYAALGGRNSKFETFMVGWIDHRIGNVGPGRCAT